MVFCLSLAVTFSKCFVSPPDPRKFCLGLSRFWGMSGERQHEWLGLEAFSLLECLPLLPYPCFLVNHTVLAQVSLHGSPYVCGALHCPLADLLWNHLWNRSEIFRRADGD